MSESRPRFKKGDIVFDCVDLKHRIIGDIVEAKIDQWTSPYKVYVYYVIEDNLFKSSISINYADEIPTRWTKVA